jgi:hypothetical protein
MTITTSSSTTRSPITIAASWTRRIRRTLAAMVVGLFAMLAVPGTAFAYTDPDRAVSTAVPVAGTAAHPAPTVEVSPSGWGLSTTLLIVAIAVLAVGIVVVGQRVARRRRTAHLTPLGA